MLLRRSNTLERLVQAKTVGFFGGLCLLFNSLTGPGIPFTAILFQKVGWGFVTSLFFGFSIVSTLSVLFIVEAMQSIPGNKHFQGTVEYSTLINFYSPSSVYHNIGQIVLFGSMQSNAIQSIVLCAQVFDQILLATGRTCGLIANPGFFGWSCVQPELTNPSAPIFGDSWIFCSLGFAIITLILFPMSYFKLSENINLQIGSFIITLLIALQWIISCFLMGLDRTKIVWRGRDHGIAVGTIMLNLGWAYVVPSWINLKLKSVNAGNVFWLTSLVGFVFYMIIGLIPAMALKIGDDGSILPVLAAYGIPRGLTQATVFAFPLIMLLPSICVVFLVSKDNLVQNEVCDDRVATFMSFVFPFIVAALLQSGSYTNFFITWTSILFVSPCNFTIPSLIYVQSLKFRKEYNRNRVLSDKQQLLLKKIHWSSKTISRFLDKRSPSLFSFTGSSNENILLGQATRVEGSLPSVKAGVGSTGSMYVPPPTTLAASNAPTNSTPRIVVEDESVKSDPQSSTEILISMADNDAVYFAYPPASHHTSSDTGLSGAQFLTDEEAYVGYRRSDTIHSLVRNRVKGSGDVLQPKTAPPFSLGSASRSTRSILSGKGEGTSSVHSISLSERQPLATVRRRVEPQAINVPEITPADSNVSMGSSMHPPFWLFEDVPDPECEGEQKQSGSRSEGRGRVGYVSNEDAMPLKPVLSAVSPTEQHVEARNSLYIDKRIGNEHSSSNMSTSTDHCFVPGMLARKNTLPANPEFFGPAFRSLPKWFIAYIPGRWLAYLIVAGTLFISIMTAILTIVEYFLGLHF